VAGESGAKRDDTAVILVWLTGGLSHMDTYDLKPVAPLEYRGEFAPICSNMPGIEVGELLPLHAKIADKFSLIRSASHGFGDHDGAHKRMLTGRTQPAANALQLGLSRGELPRLQRCPLAVSAVRSGCVCADRRCLPERSRPLSPNDLWATAYRHLGIDTEQTFPDLSGRPMPILPDGEPIRELI
jgi:hypothetical protein